jgi:hypothetical protein
MNLQCIENVRRKFFARESIGLTFGGLKYVFCFFGCFCEWYN